MLGKNSSDVAQDRLELLCRGAITKPKNALQGDLSARREILDAPLRQKPGGDRHQRLLRRTEPDRTERDVFDPSLAIHHTTVVTDRKSPVGKQEKGAEQILDSLLCTEGNRHAGDADPGKSGRRIYTRKGQQA